MDTEQYINNMVSPSQKRKGKWLKGVIQIWVTRSCDKACFGCTQGSNLAGKPYRITPEQFEEAVLSVKDYFGVVGMFGGNPAIHPEFETLCEILAKHIPFYRRGLWCNNPLGKGKIMAKTFNPRYSNLNVHLDQKAYDEFKKDWPDCSPVGLSKDSRHSPVFVSMKDLGIEEKERWELINNCDINKHWSAMIGVFRGELRAWFCEIAGSQSILMQNNPNYPDTGIPVTPDWWKKPIKEFSNQILQHCHNCSIPLRGFGELAQAEEGKEQCSSSYKDCFTPKRREREVQLVELRTDLKEQTLKNMVDYIGNSNAVINSDSQSL